MLVKAPDIQVTNQIDVVRVLREILQSEPIEEREKEHFWVIGLRANNSIKYIDCVHIGTIDSSMADPRSIFRIAVTQGISAIIVAHNHPSGNIKPSPEDEKQQTRIEDAGKILNIQVLDHIIITDLANKYYSFREEEAKGAIHE